MAPNALGLLLLKQRGQEASLVAAYAPSVLGMVVGLHALGVHGRFAPVPFIFGKRRKGEEGIGYIAVSLTW